MFATIASFTLVLFVFANLEGTCISAGRNYESTFRSLPVVSNLNRCSEAAMHEETTLPIMELLPGESSSGKKLATEVSGRSTLLAHPRSG